MNHCIILAGGSGSRIGGVPKQFRLLAGEPLLLHSVRSFFSWPRCASLTVVSGAHWMEQTHNVVSAALPGAQDRIRFVVGGETRHQSQVAGLMAVSKAGVRGEDVILVHDAARPFVSHAEMDDLIQAFVDPAAQTATLAVPATDTIVRGGGLPGPLLSVLARTELFMIKTPQAVRASALPALFACPENGHMTDLLTWGNAAGLSGALRRAGPWNMKVTVESDFAVAETLAPTLVDR